MPPGPVAGLNSVCVCVSVRVCTQEMAKLHAPELGMQTVPSLNIAYTQVRQVAGAGYRRTGGSAKLALFLRGAVQPCLAACPVSERFTRDP